MLDISIAFVAIIVIIAMMCLAVLAFRTVRILGGCLYREVKHAIRFHHLPFGVQ